MKVIWFTNFILPKVAPLLYQLPFAKEGWVTGMAEAIERKHDGGITLAIAFPVPRESDGWASEMDGVTYYGYYEDTANPDHYDVTVESRILKILMDFKPDLVHIFGTEFPHTLAAVTTIANHSDELGIDTTRILIGMQGCMGPISEHYLDGVPEKVINKKTFRDIVKFDGLKEQKAKFEARALNEMLALKIAGNVTGRTDLDSKYTAEIDPDVKYYFMNETLRPQFYEGEWNIETKERHRIFLSQANYPIKGAHYLFKILKRLLMDYPDLSVYVAGDDITKFGTIKEKIKISGYGKYLKSLLPDDCTVRFLGSLDAEGMKEQYLKCHVFVNPSTMENSPNSLGEAMLLGVPCIAADVGGTGSVFRNGSDGILYEAGNTDELIKAIRKMFDDRAYAQTMGQQARAHALATHNPDANFERLMEIYKSICR